MNDRDIDDIFERAAKAPGAVDPALVERISGAIGSSLRPVRPLPRPWVLVSALILACAAVAIGGAARLGFNGIRALSALEIAPIFSALGILTGLAAMLSAAEMAPGSRLLLSPAHLMVLASLALAAIFALLFHDYRMDGFAPQGIRCLATGLLHAIPAGLLGWLVLRRGFAVDPAAAGLAAGSLAGLTGVIVLELHCPNFRVMHVVVWHTAVIPLSALAGALLARTVHALGRRGRGTNRSAAELMQ